MALKSSATFVLALIMSFIPSRALHSQAREAAKPSTVERCGGEPTEHPAMAAIAAAFRQKEKRDALAGLAALEGPVRAAALAAPDDVSAQFHLAALLGARAEREGGGKKIPAATEAHAIGLRLISIEPGHAGANFLMGRLHAAVLRLDRVTRFLATHLLGGSGLKGASWEAAQKFLEVAERAAPCVPEHHFELARLYAERHQAAAGERERLHVLELTAGDETRWADIRTRVARLSRTSTGNR